MDTHGDPIVYRFLVINDAFCKFSGLTRGIIEQTITHGMPGMNGIDFSHIIHEEFPNLKIALVSGWKISPSEEDVEYVDKIFEKPLEIEKIHQWLITLD